MSGVGAAAKRAKGKAAAKAKVSEVNPPSRPEAEPQQPPVNKGGRPPHQPTAETRRQVEAMAVRFMSRKGIAAVIGIAENTLREHYAAELETGDGKAELNVRTGLWEAAKKGNVKALIHLSKSKLGDSEKIKHEHSGPDGGAIKHYLAIPENDRRPLLEKLAARVLAPTADAAADGFEAD